MAGSLRAFVTDGRMDMTDFKGRHVSNKPFRRRPHWNGWECVLVCVSVCLCMCVCVCVLCVCASLSVFVSVVQGSPWGFSNKKKFWKKLSRTLWKPKNFVILGNFKARSPLSPVPPVEKTLSCVYVWMSFLCVFECIMTVNRRRQWEKGDDIMFDIIILSNIR